MKRIKFFDSTMRDGEQVPGNAMTLTTKIDLLKALDKTGIDYIEVGFPAVSEQDARIMRIAAQLDLKAKIVAFSRCNPSDIDITVKALCKNKEAQIQLLMIGSEIHLKHKRHITEAQSIAEAVSAIERVKSFGFHTIAAGFEDATRGSSSYLKKMTKACVAAGATTIVYADTVGAAIPDEIFQLIQKARTWVDDAIEISVHCHNDMGLAMANSLAAIEAGADCVQGTLSGIGERTGNAALEELATVLYYKQDYYQVHTDIDMTALYQCCKLLKQRLNLVFHQHKPIIGKYAFTTAAGIHIKGLSQNPITYEYVNPEIFGRTRNLIISRFSGRTAVTLHLNKYNLAYDDDLLEQMYKAIISDCDADRYNNPIEFKNLYQKLAERTTL